jgi:hypothetical protein
LKDLNGGVWKMHIAEPKRSGFSRLHGDDEARAAVYANRTRLDSGVGKQAMRRRPEIVERSFVQNLDRGGMRRTWLRGRENVHKRYLVHVAGHNLGILMRLLVGLGLHQLRLRGVVFQSRCLRSYEARRPGQRAIDGPATGQSKELDPPRGGRIILGSRASFPVRSPP